MDALNHINVTNIDLFIVPNDMDRSFLFFLVSSCLFLQDILFTVIYVLFLYFGEFAT